MDKIIDETNLAQSIMMNISYEIDDYMNHHKNDDGCTVFITSDLSQLLKAYVKDLFRTFNNTDINTVFGVPIICVPVDGMKFWIGKEINFGS